MAKHELSGNGGDGGSFGPVVDGVEKLIGRTPLVRLHAVTQNVPAGRWLRDRYAGLTHYTLKSELWAKVEFFNPGGSVKDRIGLCIIEGLERSGKLKPGGTVVEATSGNTGAGLALVAARRGYKCVLVIPDKMSAEKINALRAFGADVIITPAAAAPETAEHYTVVARKTASEISGAVLANQYFNPDNPRSHYESTGPEIWGQMNGHIDAFVAGIGTGGTLSGTGRFLKEKNSKTQIVAVDPYGSIYHDKIKKNEIPEAKPYLVEGVGEDEIPGTMDLSLPDEVVQVDDAESIAATHALSLKEGLFTGGSCGFALMGALEYLYHAEQIQKRALRAVVLLPDSGSRYLSKVFNDRWLGANQMPAGWGSAKLGGAKYLASSKRIDGVEESK